MGLDKLKAIGRRRDSALAGLVCATLGLLLVEAVNLIQKGSMGAHATRVAIGGALILLTLRTLLKYWPPPPHPSSRTASQSRGLPGHLIRIAAYTLMAGGSCAASQALYDGLVTPFFLFVGFVSLFPWRKIARSPAHYLACWTALIAGNIGTLLLRGPPAMPFFVVAFGSFLWLIALGCWLRESFCEKSARRARDKALA